jgi:hypothetical protein
LRRPSRYRTIQRCEIYQRLPLHACRTTGGVYEAVQIYDFMLRERPFGGFPPDALRLRLRFFGP